MYYIDTYGKREWVHDSYFKKTEKLLQVSYEKATSAFDYGERLLDQSNKKMNSIFSKKCIKKSDYELLKKQFEKQYRLSNDEYILVVTAGLLASLVQLFMVGIPQRTSNGTKAGSLSNYIRDFFEKKYSTEEIRKLERSLLSKVPFDAQTNVYAGQNITSTYVNGLNPYYHRLVSLGHDPILGFVVGVFDIMTGSMTTIDRTGKIIVQQIEKYANRRETDIFAAFAKEIVHLKTDITTSMGLPAPFMGIANILQWGNFGENGDTIAQIVQGMYYEGYDFIHFISTTIPTMIVEVFVRLYIVCKRLKNGMSIKTAVCIKKDEIEYQKMQTILFLANAIVTSVNAGQLLFTKNPLLINYNEWISFSRYAMHQIIWQFVKKPELREKYILQNANIVEIGLLDYCSVVNPEEKYIVLEG